MTIYVLFALAALVASVVIGGLLRRIWEQYERRTIVKKWQERERRLDSPRSVDPWHEIREWRSPPAGTRDVAKAEPVVRVLYIVARDQPVLFAFLREDFAAEEAEGLIEIIMSRRQGLQQREADRRDPRRNWRISIELREIGLAEGVALGRKLPEDADGRFNGWRYEGTVGRARQDDCTST